ncbi:cystatin-like fold lipoprotein [Bacillus cabrialesii]|uniref:cystatin-like fold lipoprotein n=1 Tax=Bacillus cabrialesii TaxID=2487276 RepID=UPI003D9A5815
MKNLFIFLSLIMMFVLTACGGNKYDDAIDEVIGLEKKKDKEYGFDTEGMERENALIRVYDGGKYIQVAFYLPEDHSRELSPYDYFEKLGDKYEEMDSMPGNGENDRLGLSKKTPDYEEVKGKETKLEE